jgi:hypothetical protein
MQVSPGKALSLQEDCFQGGRQAGPGPRFGCRRSDMRMIIGAALAALAITAQIPAGEASAEEDVHSARSMLRYCKLTSKQTMASPRNALMYGQCFGVISGIVAMTEVMRQERKAGTGGLDPALCVEIPGDTTILQVVDAVVKYGETHPDMGGERFEIVAVAALRDAWPCAK